jgi:hypothetical protein
MVKIEKGVMIMKGGLAWGVEYQDGQSRAHGWINPADAPMRDPRYCTVPTDATYKGSPDEAELATGKIVAVERRTEVFIVAQEKSHEPQA